MQDGERGRFLWIERGEDATTHAAFEPGSVLVEVAHDGVPGVLKVRFGVVHDVQSFDPHASAVEAHPGGDAVTPGDWIGVQHALFLYVHERHASECRVGAPRQVERQRFEAQGRDHGRAARTRGEVAVVRGGRVTGGRPGRRGTAAMPGGPGRCGGEFVTVRDGDNMDGYLGRAASAVRYGRRRNTFSCLAAVDVSFVFLATPDRLRSAALGSCRFVSGG